MSERLLKEFRERAEFLVPMPDLHELQREGTQRRRVRIAAGAALVASVLALGGTVVATTIDDENAIEPAQIGPPPSADACELVANGTHGSVPSGCELHAQVDEWRYVDKGHYFVRPFNTDLRPARPGDLEAWFEIRGDYWYWWGGGVGKACHAGACGGPEMAPYIRVAITPITGVHGLRCQGPDPRPVQAVPSSPLAIAHRLVVPPGIDVLEAPRSVQKFGYDAAHVRFTVTEQCPSDQAFVLWRAFEPEDDIFVRDDITAGRTDADITIEPGRRDHVFDVWVLDVQGEPLVISADYPPDLGQIKYHEEDPARLQELLDSIRFEFTE